MNFEDYKILNTNNWEECIKIINKYWDTDYGTCELWKRNTGTETLILTTGGWSYNEEIINQLSETMFWFLWWQESKRGGYYKFIKANMKLEERDEL